MYIPISIKITLAFSLIIFITITVISLHARERFNYNFQKFCEISGFDDRRCLKGLAGRKFVEAIDRSLVGVSLLAVVLGFVVSLYLASYILKPLKEVTTAASEFKKGNYDVRIKTSTNDELNELIKTLNDLFEKISVNDKLRRDLIANISHEIFTPLTNIKGYVEAINDGVIEGKQDLTKTVNIIDEETSRVISLVKQMKELSYIESDKIPLVKDNVNIKELIESITERFKSVSNKKHIKFITNLEDMTLIVDKEKFTQALSNIISNSIKYSNQNGVVEVNTKRNNAKLEITIKDNGIGIPSNDLPFVFDRFYRVDKSRSDGESIGIGLTIAKKIIEAHNGQILLDSKLNKYTLFRIIMPLPKAMV